jgi:putative membrane protein
MHYRYKAVLAIVLLGLFSLGIETIGIHTGFPYSYFEYTNPLGVLLFNTTPWTVAIAWSPLVIGAYMLASKISQGFWSQLGYYLILLVTLDVVLDPAAVARGLWSYTNGGEFYGVPLVNFAGWIFSGILAYIILRYALGKTKKLLLSISLVSASYIASIALWTGANIGYGQTGAWIVGVFTLLVVLKILTLPTQTEG